MKKRIQKWLGIKDLQDENQRLKAQIDSHRVFVERKMSELKAYTKVDADVGVRTNNTIILTGVYKKKAFVKFYDLGEGEFHRMVEQLKDMQVHALVRNIDAPPIFHGTFKL